MKNAFAWLANNVPGKFDPNTQMSGQTQGSLPSGWWYALEDGGAVDLQELRRELTLNDEQFSAGAVRLEFDAADANLPAIVKPTAFDGIVQGSDTDPMWGSTTASDAWGLTKSEAPVREGVCGPIDVNNATRRELIAGSVSSDFAPVSGPDAGGASRAATTFEAIPTDYLEFLNGPSKDAGTGAANTQHIIDAFQAESDKSAGESAAKGLFSSIISGAGWAGGGGDLETQWSRFKTHNVHAGWP